ncbi:MAG: dephospho-CoA kinase [Flavobacteriaceae bacterium]|nr:dephospho-CoA kinase [Flavobacteriaceae bacterium]
MLIVGVTGGIGAGKTTLMKMFEDKGVPCFYSDQVAKDLLDTALKEQIISELGNSIGNQDGTINKKKMGQLVFSNSDALKKLNSLIHPKVGFAFKEFKKQFHNSLMVVKEAAILIETGSYQECDMVVLMTAPREIRKKRIAIRDSISSSMVEKRMNNQWGDKEKIPYADFVIESSSIQQLEKDFNQLFVQLTKQARVFKA